MSQVHFHLSMVHFPIIGMTIMFVLFAYGFWKREEILQKAACIIIAGLAALTLPVFLAGEGAEDAIEHMPDINDRLISLHESAAGLSLWLMMAIGILAIGYFIMLHKKIANARIYGWALLIGSIISMGSLLYTGSLGGKIRHSEIRGGFFSTHDQQGEQEEEED